MNFSDYLYYLTLTMAAIGFIGIMVALVVAVIARVLHNSRNHCAECSVIQAKGYLALRRIDHGTDSLGEVLK